VRSAKLPRRLGRSLKAMDRQHREHAWSIAQVCPGGGVEHRESFGVVGAGAGPPARVRSSSGIAALAPASGP